MEEIEEEEERIQTIQLTLRIPEYYDRKLREVGIDQHPPTNRQGAINYILDLYFTKEYFESSAEELR